MGLPWKTILTNVPWRDVVSHAPKLADGAKKFWQNLGGKNDAPEEPGTEMAPHEEMDLPARLAMLEAAQRQQLVQIRAAGDLIQGLSEQNTRLLAEVASLRQRTRRLGWGLLLSAGLALAALIVVLLRP